MQSRGRQSARGKRKHGGKRKKLRKDGTQAVGRLESDGLANRLRMAAGRMGQLQKDSLLPRLPGLPRLPARNIDRVTTGRTLGTERVGKTGPRTGAKTGAPSPARAQSGGENAGERERTSPFSRVPEWEKEAGKKATALFDEHGDYIPTKEREEARRARQQADTREMALGAPIREEELPLIDEYTGAPPAYDVNQKEAFALYNEWVRYEANVERLKRIAGYGGHLVGDISNEIRKAEKMAELAWRDYASVPINLTEETLRNSYARQYASLLSKRALITDLDRERVDMAVKALDRVIDSKWSTNEQKAQAREVRNTLYHKTTKAATAQAVQDFVLGIPYDSFANSALAVKDDGEARARKREPLFIPIELADPLIEAFEISTQGSDNPQLQYMNNVDMMKMNQPEAFAPYQAVGEAVDMAALAFGAWVAKPATFHEYFWDDGAKEFIRRLTNWAFEETIDQPDE